MKRILDRHQLRTWLSYLLLATIVIVIFRVVSEIHIIFGWFGAFASAVGPFVGGFMLAYALNIPRERIEHLLSKVQNDFVAKRKKGFSVVLAYLVVISVGVLVWNLIFPRIYESITDFVAFLPTLFDALGDFLEGLGEDSVPFIDMSTVAETFDNFALEELMGIFNIENLTMAFNTLMSFGSFVFGLALALISSVYFLVEGEKLKAFVKRVLAAIMAKRVHDVVMKYGREINSYFKRYIYCQVLDAIILGTIMTIVLTIMRVNYAFTLGPMLGVANLIPYFGSIFGTIFAFIVILVTDGVPMGVVAGIVMLVIQQFDANFIFPKLVGGSMKVSPLLVIIGIAVGNFYYGIIGMITAIPIVTVLRNIVNDLLKYIETRRERKREVDL